MLVPLSIKNIDCSNFSTNQPILNAKHLLIMCIDIIQNLFIFNFLLTWYISGIIKSKKGIQCLDLSPGIKKQFLYWLLIQVLWCENTVVYIDYWSRTCDVRTRWGKQMRIFPIPFYLILLIRSLALYGIWVSEWVIVV